MLSRALPLRPGRGRDILSRSQLDRLLKLLAHLDGRGPMFPDDATSRLMELEERDFWCFVTRLIAITVADSFANVEEMARTVGRGPRFEARPGEPSGTCGPRGGFIPYVKPYRRWLIDRDLDYAQMDRLNAYGNSMWQCAGHPERASAPSFTYRIDGETFIMQSDVGNTGENQAELHAWWDAAIGQLEALVRCKAIRYPDARQTITSVQKSRQEHLEQTEHQRGPINLLPAVPQIKEDHPGDQRSESKRQGRAAVVAPGSYAFCTST